MTIQFFVEGHYLGDASSPWLVRDGLACTPQSHLVYCSACGDIWARIAVIGKPWSPIHRTCRKCWNKDHWSQIPGSLFDHFSMYFDPLEEFPDALLEWEVVRYLEWYDRQEVAE